MKRDDKVLERDDWEFCDDSGEPERTVSEREAISEDERERADAISPSKAEPPTSSFSRKETMFCSAFWWRLLLIIALFSLAALLSLLTRSLLI